uniref:CCHC-type domain-containing protein n=1 Tax=Tanacetum cinerariifolium TaxID=118510 RepID=A0A6L2M8W3_TANCI|nr:hypothetical protein [Tanacetum cinerariifolium]
MMEIMQQLVNLLSGFQKQFPPTNNQLRTSSNLISHATMHEGKIVNEIVQRKALGNVSNAGTKGNQGYGKKTYRNGKKVICYNCRGEGHVARECKDPKRAKETQYYKDKMMMSDAKDRGVILDAEAEAFIADVECTEPYDESLALTTTTIFQVSHEDAYDSDINDGPHAAAAFMANLSSTKEANDTSSSKINELEGHIKTNKDLSRANESLKAELAQCKLEMQSLKRNKVKHDLDQAIVDRNKQNTELEQENLLLKTTLFNKEESIKALNEKNNKVVSEKKDLDERNLEEIESHPAIYDGNRLLDPTHVPSSVWETEETIALGAESRAKMFEKPRTVKPINYDVLNNSYIKFVPQKELSCEQVYWQSASAVKALFVHTRLAKKIKFQEYRDCFESPNVCDNSQSPAYNAFFEINKLKDQLQRKDITFKQLQTQLKDATVVQVGPTAGSLDKQALETEITQLKDKLTYVNIQLNSYKIENQTLSKRYEELAKLNMSSRAQLMGRITALIAENATLRAGVKAKQNSRPTQPKKPKVLTPRMFVICTKYIPPPRRENWVTPAPKPRKKQVTFREPPRPSHSTTQKTVVQQNKKPNIHVNLSTGVKPTTRASKPMSNSATWNHSTLLAKREKARRVEDHHRNLNKQNHVDSQLNVKRTGFVSNSNIVCNACNESLVFANLDNCVVRNLKSVNVKTSTAKHNVKTTKKV